MSERRAVVLGASAGVGRAIAEHLASLGWQLVLSSRDQRDLDALASDLRVRFGTRVDVVVVDLVAPDAELVAYCEAITAEPLDAAFITAGAVSDSDDGQADWATTQQLITTNFVAVVKVGGRLLDHFAHRGSGSLVVFSSIAAAAPRADNAAYAAAKAGLTSWARSQQHRLADSPVRLQVYALGYVDTEMSSDKELLLPVARADWIAERVVAQLGSRHRIGYLPRWWAPIVGVLRRVPWPIYKRLRF